MSRQQRDGRASVLDVAHRAGVAVGTVSNVLNRPELVSDATRARVEAAIAELDFVRSGPAYQLRAGTITTVGAIVLDIRNPFFTDVARGVEDRLARESFTLMLASSDDDPDREARYLRLFEEHGVRGVLVVPTSDDASGLLALRRRGVGVVLLDAPSTSGELSSVSVDDVAGGTMAVRHLLSLGHREVVMLNGSHAIRQATARLEGARAAAAEAGLDPDTAVREVRLDSLDAAGGEAAMARLMAGGPQPAAVFAVNDLVAFGVQRYLRRLGGIAALRRTALVGYDDIELAAELATPLTSVRQPTYEMGERAADLLVAGSPTSPAEHVVFRPELVVRESSAGD